MTLSGQGSTDPDGDELIYHWIYYREVGSLNASDLKLKNSDNKVVSFIAPHVEKSETMHFILAVTDRGVPALTRYQRVVVNVMPK